MAVCTAVEGETLGVAVVFIAGLLGQELHRILLLVTVGVLVNLLHTNDVQLHIQDVLGKDLEVMTHARAVLDVVGSDSDVDRLRLCSGNAGRNAQGRAAKHAQHHGGIGERNQTVVVQVVVLGNLVGGLFQRIQQNRQIVIRLFICPRAEHEE